MKPKTRIQTCLVLFAVAIFTGCSSTERKPEASAESGTESKSMARSSMESSGMPMTFGNSSNVQVFENPAMMFHDMVVSQTPEGAELEGKIHVKNRSDFLPGHIDFAVVDNKSGEKIGVYSTDFNQRIARHGHRNLKHPNNISLRLPGVDPDSVTIYVAYHHSNLDRLSKVDCGANVAVATLSDKGDTKGMQ